MKKLIAVVVHCFISCAKAYLIHVAYASSSNKYHIAGLTASVKSIVVNSKNTSRLVFHIFEVEKDVLHLDSLKLFVSQRNSTIIRHIFSNEEVLDYINIHLQSHKSVRRLLEPANYVRYIIAQKLAGVDKCLYLDTDTIIVGDINPFMDARTTEKVISAFPREKQTLPLSTYTTLRDLGINVADPQPSFNAGILVLNLHQWRVSNMSRIMRNVSLINKKYNLWGEFGSQPALLVTLGGNRFEKLNPELVLNNFGSIGRDRLQSAKDSVLFLHWSGPRKPWLKERSNNAEMWHEYFQSK